MKEKSRHLTPQRRKLTPEVPEVNGLPVGVQQLDHRVVALVDLAADGRHFSFDHCHVLCEQILSITLKKGEKKFPSIKIRLMGSIQERSKKCARELTPAAQLVRRLPFPWATGRPRGTESWAWSLHAPAHCKASFRPLLFCASRAVLRVWQGWGAASAKGRGARPWGR